MWLVSAWNPSTTINPLGRKASHTLGKADCGGTLSCATCHVYVDPAWVERLPQPDLTELELMEGVAAERRPNSRLSCQILLTEALDGLTLEVPARQF